MTEYPTCLECGHRFTLEDVGGDKEFSCPECGTPYKVVNTMADYGVVKDVEVVSTTSDHGPLRNVGPVDYFPLIGIGALTVLVAVFWDGEVFSLWAMVTGGMVLRLAALVSGTVVFVLGLHFREQYQSQMEEKNGV